MNLSRLSEIMGWKDCLIHLENRIDLFSKAKQTLIKTCLQGPQDQELVSLWKGPFSHYTRLFLLTPKSSLELSTGLSTLWKETFRKVSRELTLPTCGKRSRYKKFTVGSCLMSPLALRQSFGSAFLYSE